MDCLLCNWLDPATDSLPAGGWLYEGANWNLLSGIHYQDIPGWVVLTLRRHAETVADLSDQEARELGPLIGRVYSALEEITGVDRIYIVNFGEAVPRHFHVLLAPRPADLPEDKWRGNLFEYGLAELKDAGEAERVWKELARWDFRDETDVSSGRRSA